MDLKGKVLTFAVITALSIGMLPELPGVTGQEITVQAAEKKKNLNVKLTKPKKGKVTTNSIQVEFLPSKKKEVKRYCLYIRQKGTSKWKRVNVSKSRKNYTFKGLKQNTNYQIRMRVQGKNGYKYSKYTKTVTVKTLKQAYASVITKVSGSDEMLTVKWKKAKNASKYVVYRATLKNGKYIKIATVSNKVTSYKDKELIPDQTYWYRVYSYTSDKTYKKSLPVSGKTDACNHVWKETIENCGYLCHCGVYCKSWKEYIKHCEPAEEAAANGDFSYLCDGFSGYNWYEYFYHPASWSGNAEAYSIYCIKCGEDK